MLKERFNIRLNPRKIPTDSDRVIHDPEPRAACLSLTLTFLALLWAGMPFAAEPANGTVAAGGDPHAGDQPDLSHKLGFSHQRSVEGELAETANRHSQGALADFEAQKKDFQDRTGLTYGADLNALYLHTDSDRSPADAATGVLRFYGTWTASQRGTADEGALVFKVDYRSALGSKIAPTELGSALGYAGLFSSTFSDSDMVLTNLYWRQHFAAGRGAFIVGQVDVTDYVSVNNLANPWIGFNNLAFQQPPTLPAPAQGLGAAVLWRMNDNWAVLSGFADANADPSDPWDSATDFFEEGESLKHVAVGWSPDWGDRYNQLSQLTLWQVDDRDEAGIKGGQGVDFAASASAGKWLPFLRVGYAEDGGAILDRAITVGTGYMARGGKDLAGVGVNWGRAPDLSRDQFTVEAFYRLDIMNFVQITPELQYVVNPAFDTDSNDILVLGMRLRIFF